MSSFNESPKKKARIDNDNDDDNDNGNVHEKLCIDTIRV